MNETELDVLNRIVSAYLDIAEIQALDRNPMYMQDWINKLNDFLKLTGKDILKNAGSISHKQATQKAETEYIKYKEQTKNELSDIEKHFIKQIETTAKKIISKNKNKK